MEKNNYIFYKDEPGDKIFSVEREGDTSEGEYLFSFDEKKVYNFWEDYPDKLTPEEVEIFKKERPIMASLR